MHRSVPVAAGINEPLRCLAMLLGAVIMVAVPAAVVSADTNFTAFESGQVRPVVLSADGSRLYVANTPDNRVEIFDVTGAGLVHEGAVGVGLEPVALALRDENELWVVNHLSDSVSIVQVGGSGSPRVLETLLVGDEPRDIVFASGRAFVTTAHRGQSSPIPFQPLAEEGRADVWVFDASDRDFLTIVTLFGDTPRPLAVSPDGKTVYAGIFNSGNRTTIMSTRTVAGNIPPPLTNVFGDPAPLDVGLIVRYDGRHWLDGAGRQWDRYVRLSLPDYDVFAIDASANPPVEVARYAGVGTTLYNIAVNPESGVLYVSNTEARNDVRFEGPGEFGGSTVRGHFIENRITVISDGVVQPRHLNKHINYDQFPGTPEENAASLALPLQMAVSADGATLYLAAFGSSEIGVFSTDDLEDDSFVPSPDSHIGLSGGGPSGLALDEARGRLYVLTRFDNSVSVVDLRSDPIAEIAHMPLYNPEPASIVNGRPFLYDAHSTSSRGDSSCGGCHVFGDNDALAWDLGNPDGISVADPNPFIITPPPGIDLVFHPMKGPMVTQSLRGMAGNGPMHWRGDRTGGGDVGGDPMDENAAFLAFNVAFEGLIGRDGQLPEEDMQAFADFALQLMYPPNPIRALNNSRTPIETEGKRVFENDLTDQNRRCVDCHTFDPAQGIFGTSGFSVVRMLPTGEFRQPMKVPHLRDIYTKVGYFGSSRDGPGQPAAGEQVRGFGYRNEGSADTILTFLEDFTIPNEQSKYALMYFLMAFDNNLAPVVGQQVTLSISSPFAEIRTRLSLLQQRAKTTPAECDLVARGNANDEARSWLFLANGAFQSDRADEPIYTLQQLRLLARTAEQEITFTCVPPGSGVRIALDRDSDGYYDRDELDAGSDPADPLSIPQ